MKHLNIQQKAERFIEELERLVKNYGPEDFATKFSLVLEDAIDDIEQMRIWTPHNILNAIEANCIYHRNTAYEKLDVPRMHKIMNFYHNYHDPVSEYLLEPHKNGLTNFMIYMAKQQFYIQIGYGRHDVGRSILLFKPSFYRNTEKEFIRVNSISFNDWIVLSFGVYSGLMQRKPGLINENYFINSEAKLIPDKSVYSYFSLISVTPQDIRVLYEERKNKISSNRADLFTIYFQSVFLKKPLLKISDNQYLAVLKKFVLGRSVEGLYDLNKSNQYFGVEFGNAFENYIGLLLGYFFNSSYVYAEKRLRKYTSEKICDYMISIEDYLVLIECKGIEYSSILSTEKAIIQDNSTTKIVSAIEQLSSTIKMIRDGVFTEFLGNKTNQVIIPIIVIYKQIYFANSDWYKKLIYDKVIQSKGKDVLDVFENFSPEILSVSTLEMLLLKFKHEYKDIKSIYIEKRGMSSSITGDWDSFIKLQKDYSIEFLSNEFDRFFDKITNNITGNSDN